MPGRRVRAGRGSYTTGHRFSDVPPPRIQRSMLNRSHSVTTAFDTGLIIPILRDELLPGDSFRLRPTIFARAKTLLHPIMDNVYLDFHVFAVPLRLIWSNSEEFFGAEPGGPGTRVDRQTPKLDCTSAIAAEELHDYLGYVPGFSDATSARWPNNLYARAYNLIWNEYYRHAELDDLVPLDLDDGPDDQADYVLLRRRKRHDYFTSCNPWPNKGAEVTVPLGTSAPITGTIAGNGVPTFVGPGMSTGDALEVNTTGANTNVDFDMVGGSGPGDLSWSDPNLDASGLSADLSNAVSPTINDLRYAFAQQHLFEQFARGGSARYTELIRSVFGVVSPDARLQRPELLGAMSQLLSVNPVASASRTVGALGDLGAYGVTAQTGRSVIYSSTEHQVLLGLISVRTDLKYFQGHHRDLLRDTRFDYYYPAFANIGEQAVESREIFTDGTASDLDVFGYIGRFDEYRHKPSVVTGKMRSGVAGDVDYWHLGEEFATRPTLNSTFMEEDQPFARVIIVNSEPEFFLDAWMDYRHARPMPAFAVPGLRRL